MTLHLITYPYQALQGANYSDLINPKGKFSDPTCRFLTATSDFGYSFSLLQLKDTRNTRKCHIVFANQKENSLPERGSSKHDEMLKSISAPSGNNQFQENSNVNIVIPVSHSEVNPKKDDFGYPVNRQNLLDRLKAVHLHVLASEQWNASRLKLCHRNYLVSATNLIHYMALKCLDIEQLKEELTFAGLLNLETINPYILASIDAGIQVLENKMSISLSSNKITNSMNLNVENVSDSLPSFQVLDHIKKGDFTISAMRRKVLAHENSLLGPRQGGRTTQIMVTIGKEVTENETLVSDLLSKGTTIFRINCAHGDPSVWSEIISRIKRSSMKLEKPCQILMDLAGPKLRTDHMKPGPSVMKISPKKDATGSVIFPAQVWLSHTGSGPPPAHLSPDVVLFVDSELFLSCLEVGDVLRFYDTKGRKRSLKISKRFPVFAGVGFMAECLKTSYVESGTKFYQKRKKGMNSVGRLVNVPALEPFVRLKTGDLLVISRDPCSIVKEESGGSTVGAPRVSCSSSYLFDSVKPGEPIAFDDGKIWGVIQGSSSSEIIVSITHASPKGSKLGSEKSINIPQSEIKFEGLTSKDLLDLDFVAENADMVGISFIRNVRDVVVLQQELEQRRLNKLGIVLKIETQSGFENLPFLLLQAMQSSNPLGVMIARGDLAVECGWENLADIQEDILSVCGAAHVPVIWATQVLESLVKSGLPSRAEITDVANGRRASCIMLNKGKYIVGAVSTLNSILQSSSKKMKSDLKPLLLSNQ